MERKRWIKYTQNRTGRAYSLTEQGREIIDNINGIAEKIQGFIKNLLKNRSDKVRFLPNYNNENTQTKLQITNF